MFNKFILSLAPNSKKHLVLSVITNVINLFLSIGLTATFIYTMYLVIENKALPLLILIPSVIVAIIARYFLVRESARQAYLATGEMKKKIRSLILEKNSENASSPEKGLTTAELVQLSLEGVEQTENYISVFIPQFFYSIISVVIVFTIISFFSLKTALVLVLAIPLIPLSVLTIVKFAKKIFSKYWGNYTNLGDDFLDNTSGMTTLKTHQTDEAVANKLNTSAEKFRKMTMRVLTMQLNSITVMDAIAFGGAAVAIVMGLGDFFAGHLSIYEMLFVTLVSAEFFLPLRALGSAFHIAMNGISAAKKIEAYLNRTPPVNEGEKVVHQSDIKLNNVTFKYDDQQKLISSFNMEIKQNQFIALVGDSGSGKSTIAGLLTGYQKIQSGTITINNKNVDEYDFFSLNEAFRTLSYNSRIFKGTIRSNLLLGKKEATEQEMYDVLNKAAFLDFVKEVGGLDYDLSEGGTNLSGGEKQRLALARFLLTSANFYIFDEALSSVDRESENNIMPHLYRLTDNAAVLFITHRLEVIKDAHLIYFLDGEQTECGTHEQLIAKRGKYFKMYQAQSKTLNLEGEVK